MKKIILFVVFGLISSSTAFAEELVVHLTSGNAVVVQYAGTIQGVTFQGKTDAIAGLDMPTATKSAANAKQPAAAEQTVNCQPAQVAAKKEEGRWLRFKWAEPKTED